MKKVTWSLQSLQQQLLQIPPGKVVTYAEMARALGKPRAVRAVGALCGSNPEPDTYPCFKVIKSDGGIGGYSAKGGKVEKIRRLREEGIEVTGERILDLAKSLHRFSS
ncbi:MAG: MGMT family protein [bacterium]|nr:MGMT family protein [bacterium]